MASIDRSALSGLIPEPVTREIMQGAIAESAVLRMGRRLANMSSKTQTINVLDALPSAYFVNGEATGDGAGNAFKQTTKMAWDKKKLYAEEIAVIVPIPEAALDDADYDIWGEVKPRLTAKPGKNCVGAFKAKYLRDVFKGQRLHIYFVGDMGVGHYRRGVRVHKYNGIALFFKGETGLCARIVKLGGLTDNDRSGADYKYFFYVGAFWH